MTGEPIEVTQADREAADRLWCDLAHSSGASAPDRYVQAFARHRLSAAKPEWRDIASAPRDGTWFDVWVPSDDGGYRVPDRWFNARGLLCQLGHPAPDLPRWPSHWRPKPDAPGTPPTSEREGNWVLVPREPTEAMLEAGVPFSVNLAWVTELWSAMLAASPNQERQRG